MVNELVVIFSTIITYALGKISKKLNWNETLPIPIQNILVGIVVFVTMFIYQKATGEITNYQDIIQQIVYALGGSGIATLGYDAKKSTEENY